MILVRKISRYQLRRSVFIPTVLQITLCGATKFYFFSNIIIVRDPLNPHFHTQRINNANCHYWLGHNLDGIDNNFEGWCQNFLAINLIINLNSDYHTYCQMRFGPGWADIKTCISHGYDMNMTKLIRIVIVISITITSLTSFP